MIMEAITQDDDPCSSFYAPVVTESCLPTFLHPFSSTLTDIKKHKQLRSDKEQNPTDCRVSRLTQTTQ
jgi:hypothetical protein